MKQIAADISAASNDQNLKDDRAFVAGLFADGSTGAAAARAKAELFYAGFVGLQALASSQKIDVGARMTELLDACRRVSACHRL